MQSEYVQAREKLATVVVSHVPVVRYDFRPKAIYIALMVRRIIQAMHDETVVDDKDYCMCCSVLQRVAACCSVLQRVAVRCEVLQGVAGWQCTTHVALHDETVVDDQDYCMCCSVLQRVAACCSVLQCVAGWQCTTTHVALHDETVVDDGDDCMCCSVLQCIAVCCSVL